MALEIGKHPPHSIFIPKWFGGIFSGLQEKYVKVPPDVTCQVLDSKV